MPRQLVKSLALWVKARRHHWYLRLFGERIAERHLWSLSRRSVGAAVGAGVAIAFIPLPAHTLMAVLAAVVWRMNLPVTIAATWVINPFTLVPGFYGAYRLGAWLLRESPSTFSFELSWNWLERGLGPRWQAFLLGCLVLSRYALKQQYLRRRQRRAS
jgi:uncharacterized protein (DUF2062 family)